MEVEDLVGVSTGVNSEELGLMEESVEGFQDEGVTGCFAVFLSLGIIRPE